MQLRKLILPISILISLLIYYPTHDYGLVTDYLGWLNKYRDGGWSDVWHCFNYPGLHQVFHFVNYGIFRLVNADTFGLYLIFSITHGSVAYIMYRFFRKFGEWMKWEEVGTISFFASILFLISPYQVEAVTWKACYHYLMVTGFTGLGAIMLIKYLEGNGKFYLFGHFLLFLGSLFTIEIGLVTPGIYGLIYLSYFYLIKDRKVLRKGIWLSIIHLLFLIGYFVLTKLVIGDYIGHYGAEKHMVFTPTLLISTAAKYLVKYIFYTHYFSFQTRYDIYALLSKSIYGIAVVIPLIIAFIIGMVKTKKNTTWLMLSFGIASFIIGLLPVLNLYFMNLHFYENDRYGYFASPFLYLALISFFFLLVPKFKYSLSLLFIVLSCFFTYKTIATVKVAGETITSLVEDFRWYDDEHIVIAGLPENHNGVYMFRDFSDEGVALIESLEWKGRKIYKGEIRNLSKFNLKGRGKHLDVKFIGKDTLQVWDVMPGSWFWRKGVGMSSYDKNGTHVNMKEGHFHATFDTVYPGTVFIYPLDNKFVELEN